MCITKDELRTGDIIVNAAGYLGVVLKDEDYVLYQDIGMDWLHEFNEDLTFDDEEYRDGDIMQVFRGCTFIDLEDNYPYWERDDQWTRPTAEERKKHEVQAEQKRREQVEAMRRMKAEMVNGKSAKEMIYVVSQYFYGNRTGTEISLDWVDHFLRGQLSREHYGPNDIEDVVRKLIHVPGTDNIVIVYDQTQEDRYVHEDFPEIYARDGAAYKERWGEELTMHISCEIPEIEFKIHTRCFACRVSENGVLQSLEDGDSEKFIHYFPTK